MLFRSQRQGDIDPFIAFLSNNRNLHGYGVFWTKKKRYFRVFKTARFPPLPF